MRAHPEATDDAVGSCAPKHPGAVHEARRRAGPEAADDAVGACAPSLHVARFSERTDGTDESSKAAGEVTSLVTKQTREVTREVTTFATPDPDQSLHKLMKYIISFLHKLMMHIKSANEVFERSWSNFLLLDVC